MIKRYLLAPGPTPVPPEVLAAIALPDHPPSHAAVRAPSWPRCRTGCASSSAPRQDVLVLAASGTGAMEGAVTNLLSPGDEAIVVNGGKFGERWTKICQAYGVTVARDRASSGAGRSTRGGRGGARRASRARARVYVQASETSTCVLHPVPAHRRAHAHARHAARRRRHHGGRRGRPADGPARHRRAASPARRRRSCCRPGLAFVALSERAWQATRARDAAALLLRLHARAEGRARSGRRRGRRPSRSSRGCASRSR